MANLYVLPGFAIKAGIQPGFRVKAKIQQGSTTIDLDKALNLLYEDTDVKINKFDFSIPVGLSYEIKGITLDARYNIGLTKLISGADETVRNSVFVLTLGYKLGR
ncbi:MAG: PorT family protein, partial [Prevotella sp.]|nr:PorT family protein [Prevotella sp.]